jgi:hypothetical protein
MLLVAMVFVAAWTVLGAVPILVAKSHDSTAMATYLESRLFAIRVDGDYLTAIVVYGYFLLVFAGVVLVGARMIGRRRSLPVQQWQSVVSSFPHGLLVLQVLLAMVIQWVMIEGLVARAQGTSLYLDRELRAGRIEAYLGTGSVVAASLGMALLVVDRNRSGRRRLPIALAYLGCLAVIYYLNWMQGHRRLLLDALVAFVVAVATLRRRGGSAPVRRAFLALALGLAFIFVSVVGVSRGRASVSSVGDALGILGTSATDVGALYQSWVGTAELYAAHMSMYGVLSQGGGGSLAAWLGGNSTYAQYAELVKAPLDQGFTIHPVAAWWMLVGPVAPAIVVMVTAAVLLFAYRLGLSDPLGRLGPLPLCALSVPALAVPSILMRGGPEALWGLSLEVAILPAVFLLWPWNRMRRLGVKVFGDEGSSPGGAQRSRVTRTSSAGSSS